MMEPIDKIMKEVTERMDASLRYVVSSTDYGDSPIERILFAAIIGISKTDSWPVAHVVAPMYGEPAGVNYGCPQLYISRQAPINKYRADFLVQLWIEKVGWKTLVVECDGHEFHERTKEQAAKDRSRDREMTLQGHTVFRFTGSEIYRDPIKCASQIFSWAARVDLAATE